MILEVLEYQVVGIADNGEKAIQMYKKFPEKPDIVLMDHRMPIKDGIETTKELLLINEHAKILFLSADISIKQLALNSGAVDFLEKPFRVNQLINGIKNILNSKFNHK